MVDFGAKLIKVAAPHPQFSTSQGGNVVVVVVVGQNVISVPELTTKLNNPSEKGGNDNADEANLVNLFGSFSLPSFPEVLCHVDLFRNLGWSNEGEREFPKPDNFYSSSLCRRAPGRRRE
jgi:hypothetical protein